MNPTPAYKNPAVIFNVLGAILSALPSLGLLPVPVVGQIVPLLTFGLSIFNAVTHHNTAKGLAVVSAAAGAATKVLDAGAAPAQQ